MVRNEILSSNLIQRLVDLLLINPLDASCLPVFELQISILILFYRLFKYSEFLDEVMRTLQERGGEGERGMDVLCALVNLFDQITKERSFEHPLDKEIGACLLDIFQHFIQHSSSSPTTSCSTNTNSNRRNLFMNRTVAVTELLRCCCCHSHASYFPLDELCPLLNLLLSISSPEENYRDVILLKTEIIPSLLLHQESFRRNQHLISEFIEMVELCITHEDEVFLDYLVNSCGLLSFLLYQDPKTAATAPHEPDDIVIEVLKMMISFNQKYYDQIVVPMEFKFSAEVMAFLREDENENLVTGDA
jgi:hypothetical protein